MSVPVISADAALNSLLIRLVERVRVRGTALWVLLRRLVFFKYLPQRKPSLIKSVIHHGKLHFVRGGGYMFFNHVKHSIYYKCGYYNYRF